MYALSTPDEAAFLAPDFCATLTWQRVNVTTRITSGFLKGFLRPVSLRDNRRQDCRTNHEIDEERSGQKHLGAKVRSTERELIGSGSHLSNSLIAVVRIQMLLQA
jgi:hypothetical protein